MSGIIAVIVGPSGAGKDSLMDFAREHLSSDAGFHFVRRVITRPENAGGEAHLAVQEAEFSRLAESGVFALHWQAHGLSYGVPKTTFEALEARKVLVVNGSRSALPAFREAYGERLRVVLVTAPRAVLTERLIARGREDATSIRKRLERDTGPEDFMVDVTIVNDGALDEAGDRLLTCLREFREARRVSRSVG
jgi:ribose 1,5-bisphosphokinase